MVPTQSTQILLLARRDPQGPVRRILLDAGYPVVTANSASAAIRTARSSSPGLIVADLRALTSSSQDELTSYALEHDIPLILGWSDSESLLAQVEQALGSRTSPGEEAQQLVVGSLRVDLTRRVAQLDGTPLDLTAREFELLAHLARHPGWVYSRQELLEQVWGYEYGESRVVTVHIANLRKKVEAVAPGAQLIETVRNTGYRLVVPSETEPTPAPPPPPTPEARPSQGERRLVTVLSAGVVDFAALSERLDPGALRDLVNACFERVLPAIERYGGTIDKVSGEEILAVFGAPQAHENDPERALRAALEMREALVALNRQQETPLELHFGVNSGFVYAGAVGAGAHQDYSVMGDTVTVAACLKAVAGPGEILVGVDTHHQIQHLFAFGRAEAVSLTGKAQTVSVCRLIGSPGAAPPSERLSRGLSSPLVGREAELTSFQECLTKLRTGQGGILILTGEAGLGKSRLVAEVRAEARKKGASWLEGRTLSFGRTMSYWPLLEIIQQDAGIESDDPEAERWAKLAGRVGGLFVEERDEILPYLATLLNISLPEQLAQKVKYLDGEGMGRQIYRATRLYLARLAKERPTVIVFEDLHWLDGSSAALLEHLLPLTKEISILFCLISRPEPESPLTRLQEISRTEYAEHLTEIDLEPLSAQESAQLACNLLRLDLPPRLQESITEKAEGNPFYVEEVVRSLIDQGGLVQDPGSASYRVTEQAARISIPDTLLGVITARIDRLDDDLKQVLRLASVVGRSFFYRVLAAIAQAEQELDKDLADLEERELIREKTRDPELEYIFKHALVQEAAYESILVARRTELHRQVAEVIETLFAERLEEFYSLLAYHYSKAEDWGKAQDYLFRAGDQAGSIAADAEALAHYEEALEAYTRVFGDKWDPVERAILERKMGEALYRIGEHARAREYLYRALILLGSPYPASPWALRWAMVGQLLIQLGHRLFWWLPRRTLSPETLRVAWERQWIYLYLAVMDLNNGPRMLLDTVVGHNMAEATGIWGGAGWDSAISFICDFIPLRRISRYYYGRADRWLEHGWSGDSREERDYEGVVHLMVGQHEYVATGEWTKALNHLRTARQDLFAVGDIRYWGAATDELSHLLTDRGDLDDALEICQEGITFGRETGDRVAEAWGQMDAGDVLFAQGAFAEAEAHLRPAAQQLLASLDLADASKTNARIAHCYLKQGRLEEARAILAEAGTQLRESGFRGYFARNVRTGNAAACLLGLEQAAGVNKKRAFKVARNACRDLLKHGRADIPALVSGYRMQGTYEHLRGRPSKAEKWWDKSLEHAEKLGARYEGALTRLEMGRRLGDRPALETAEAAFAQMGAQFDLAQARELLDGTSRV